MNEWREPQHSTKAVPTLRLLFPTWGLGLDAQQRAKVQAKWNKNDVLIPAHAEMVTVVSFVIMDNGTRFERKMARRQALPSAFSGWGQANPCSSSPATSPSAT